MTKLPALLAALLVATVGFAPAPVADPPPPDDDGFVMVSDPEWETAGDWGDGSDNQAAVGEALGQDLLAAYIRLDEGAASYTFRIEAVSLPAVGGMPEATRYGWAFTYNKVHFELDGKFTNYSRGACDPTSGQCPPPRDPGLAPFFLRGNCVTEGSLTTCEELGAVNAVFDAASAIIDITVPVDMLTEDGVQPCDRVAPAASFIGDPLWAAPSAFVTLNTGPHDAVWIEYDYVIPPVDPEEPCDL